MTTVTPKLFLYSMSFNKHQAESLTKLVGKKAKDISFAVIENAADVEPGSETWLDGFREMLLANGYHIEQLDLRKWTNNHDGLYEKLASKDVIWIGGGNTYYLRWILKETGADGIIQTLVGKGQVYAGWSAGALIAGPTIAFIDEMEPRKVAPEIILNGLNLFDTVVIPHIDNREFAVAAVKTKDQYQLAGYNTVTLADNQVLVVNGNKQQVI